ncbi:MAG: 3-methyladenine DNA glycosylase [Methanobrevibacter sp.]|jgi:N-glycosylase/DNA lyase|nr:3-methyladenine DNA glycosylase [Candidatus Methanovirga basalitermitum]
MKLDYKINLQLTQESGQTSQPSWKLIENEYCNVCLINETPILLKVSQNSFNHLEVNYELLNENHDINEKLIHNEIAKIYDLNFDLIKFYKFLSKDKKLESTIKFCNGLRLFLTQNPFESIISSITSANNSIVRWTKSIDTISSKWGKSYNFHSGTFYTFPNPKILSNTYEDEIAESEGYNKKTIENCINNLKACGIGYRASYVKKASKIFSSKINPLDIKSMNFDEAFETLIKIPGIGPKVADCILLYGYGFTEAFPSDVWIKRIISYLYFDEEDVKVEKVRTFGMEKFKEYAGYAQLYLFHFARKSGLMNKLKPKN